MPALLERAYAAYTLVTDPTAQRVLLVRNQQSGQWKLPGGRRQHGEILPEASAREAFTAARYNYLANGLPALPSDAEATRGASAGRARQRIGASASLSERKIT
ncbi:NUDIX hydrolase [Streptomyces sp. NPDC048659]|uniref:NUDIX hydrolase n=1 Tax=Streptomyces sp. NPDC048659 TaxID=3155489 RepID=UPI00342725C7